MGLEFGNLYKIRGIIYYRISPYEQNPLAGLFSKGFPNFIRRCKESIPEFLPPTVAAYLVYDYNIKEYKRLNKKNPKDFENDV